MAMTFELAVECGPEERAAVAVEEHFNGFTIALGEPEQQLYSSCRVATWQDDENNWWCSILPSGASMTGGDDNTIKSENHLYQLAMALYAKLKSSPGFRYAVCGFDVTPFDTYSRLLQQKGSSHLPFDGLVLNRAMWEELERPHGYEQFREDAMWMPYKQARV